MIHRRDKPGIASGVLILAALATGVAWVDSRVMLIVLLALAGGIVLTRGYLLAYRLFIVRERPLWMEPRRRRRQARGLCGCCGYDLRASAGRCPECGESGKSEV